MDEGDTRRMTSAILFPMHSGARDHYLSLSDDDEGPYS